MMPLSEAANILNGALYGDDRVFESVSTDTRTIEKNALFVALKGENFDGHRFVQQAADNGAVGAVVSVKDKYPLSSILVNDTRASLGELASAWRLRFNVPVVGITGSNGKTTVKEMVAAICSVKGSTVSTQGNLNNDIGVPLSVLRLRHGHEFAVFEMGANHAGEIAYLTDIAKPDVAVITNAMRAHLEGFGSHEGVAKAKGEIFSGLRENGTAILNRDDAFYEYWYSLNKDRDVVTFGWSQDANVWSDREAITCSVHKTGKYPGVSLEFAVHAHNEEQQISLPLLGIHNVKNALAAIAVTRSLNIGWPEIQKGLSLMQPVKGRLQAKQSSRGAIIIDDTYNANPDSLKAAIDATKLMEGRRVLVAGDMGELGDDAASLHEEIGVYAKTSGIESLYAIGQFSERLAKGFGEGAQAYVSQNELLKDLNASVDKNCLVLVKGSRFMKMENIVEGLQG